MGIVTCSYARASEYLQERIITERRFPVRSFAAGGGSPAARGGRCCLGGGDRCGGTGGQFLRAVLSGVRESEEVELI